MQCDTTAWYTSGWVEWNNANVTDSEKYMAGPNGSLTSANGAGQYNGCAVSGNALLRGSDWNGGAYSGLFGTYLIYAPSFVNAMVGFRCVLEP